MTELDRLANEHASERALANTELDRVLDLVRWLAAKWGDNNPAFPDRDPMTGQSLDGNAELSQTWYRVVRGGYRCGCCVGTGHHYRYTDDADVVHLELCDVCDGAGFTSSPEYQPDEAEPGD